MMLGMRRVSQWYGHAVENMFGGGAEFEKGRGSKMSCMSVFPNKTIE